jgi:hypothetical protein
MPSWFIRPRWPDNGRFTQLSAGQLLSTIDKLEHRIAERFPESGLRQVCREFCQLATRSEALAIRLQRPIWPVRLASLLAGALLLFVACGAVIVLTRQFTFNTNEIGDLIQATEAAINELIFLGLALYFLVNLETRIKRNAALEALHRLRSIAHVVDMHQLTKDPAHLLGPSPETDSSPERSLSRYELTRYLDYCSEMLALDSKVAALFAQDMEDPIVLNAVNDLESLTQGLSGKIWQKIMILDLAEEKS